MDPEAKAYREALEQHQHAETVLDEEAYLNKITQLFFFRKKPSTTKRGPPTSCSSRSRTPCSASPSTPCVRHLISGMEDDLYQTGTGPSTTSTCCYRVASVVGLMCIEIYGYEDPKARKYAESWGFSAPTNVLRDVGEDIHRDRVYLPSEG